MMGNENGCLINALKVTKEFNLKLASRVKALDDVDISVSSGEFLSIIGRSGSGKSTLLNILGALDTPTKGEVFFEGRKLGELSDKELALIRRDKIGFIFQTFNLFPTFTVRENIELALFHHNMSHSKKDEKVEEMLTFFELQNKKKSLPHELSVGQQQKVAIARALVKEPVVILADEPTGEMDPIAGSEIAQKFFQLTKEFKVTIIVASHGSFPYKNTDRQIFLKNGKIVSKIEAGY